MILDTIYNGDFCPEEMGFMDDANYRDAMREIGFCRAALLESLNKEDQTFLEQLIAQTQCAEAIACSRSFQYGLAAGLVLMQEAQALVREQGVTEGS